MAEEGPHGKPPLEIVGGAAESAAIVDSDDSMDTDDEIQAATPKTGGGAGGAGGGTLGGLLGGYPAFLQAVTAVVMESSAVREHSSPASSPCC